MREDFISFNKVMGRVMIIAIVFAISTIGYCIYAGIPLPAPEIWCVPVVSPHVTFMF